MPAEGRPIQARTVLRAAGEALEDVSRELCSVVEWEQLAKVVRCEEAVVVAVGLVEGLPERGIELGAAQVDASGDELRPTDAAVAVEVHGIRGLPRVDSLGADALQRRRDLRALDAAAAGGAEGVEPALDAGPLVRRPAPRQGHGDALVEDAVLRELEDPPGELRRHLSQRRPRHVREERVGEALGGRRPQLPMTGHHLRADLHALARGLLQDEPIRRRVHAPEARGARRVAGDVGEGQLQGQELVEDDAAAEDVRLWRDLALPYLRRHRRWSAHGVVVAEVAWTEHLGHAKVDDHDMGVVIAHLQGLRLLAGDGRQSPLARHEHDVGGLDVQVHDSVSVDVHDR
mmetsp:Transcript_12926/g.37284  ORF Transcript_12926/g.37284 Transcript_12926/m.37284 type:complete len:345 (+) Transcript_12926:424-1458(+)